MSDTSLFLVGPTSVSALGDAIVGEAQDQWHFDPHNLDALTTGLGSAVQQLPTTLSATVQQFVSHFESNYASLLNQRIVIGQILKGQVAPATEKLDLQIQDSFQ
ncbi:MAG: hypothetical protein ABI456_01890 [Ktedonobacteraceae bacterium]